MAMDGVEIMRPRRVTPKVFSELYGATKMAEDVHQLAATDREWTLPPIFFVYIHSSRWHHSIGSAMNSAMKIGQPIL
jgi:hypothetical protein